MTQLLTPFGRRHLNPQFIFSNSDYATKMAYARRCEKVCDRNGVDESDNQVSNVVLWSHIDRTG